ncbi:hypothetical protein LguiB_021802 [Lonicera macranthoides]
MRNGLLAPVISITSPSNLPVLLHKFVDPPSALIPIVVPAGTWVGPEAPAGPVDPRTYPSTHSTTGSTSTTTGVGLPIRSIRSRHVVADGIISGMQASSSNKKRRAVTGKKTAAIVRMSEKSRVTYDPAIFGLPKDVRSRLVSDMRVMTSILLIRCSSRGYRKRLWIASKIGSTKSITTGRRKAMLPFQWTSYIARTSGYTTVCILQELGTQMAQIRASKNKKAHSGGPRTFVLRAHELKQKGDQAPHLITYVKAYKKYDPDRVSARTAKVEKMMADLPPAPVIFYDTHVSVLETATDSSRSIELEVRVPQFRAHQVVIEEQLQRERGEQRGIDLILNTRCKLNSSICSERPEFNRRILPQMAPPS